MSLAEMTVTQAASAALEVLHAGVFLKSRERRRERGYEVDDNQTWQDYLRDEFGQDSYDDEDTEEMLADIDNQKVWENAKYETNGPYTVEGWTAEVVASYGGEGEGDQYWMVISVTDGITTRFLRRDGWYASYDGGYLDGETYEVTPVQKLVTFYE